MVSRISKLALWWRDAGLRSRIALFLLGTLGLVWLVYMQRPDDSAFQSNNLLFFALVNVNLVLLLVLGFLIGRNIVKLVFDRRRKILGSRLRQRLVLAFIGLALVPTVILFVVSSGLLNRAMEDWFGSQIEQAFGQSIQIARQHFTLLDRMVGGWADQTARELRGHPLLYRDKQRLTELLDQVRQDNQLFSVTLRNAQKELVGESSNALSEVEMFQEPPPNATAWKDALAGRPSVLPEQTGASQYIRGYAPTSANGQPAVLLVTLRVNPELADALTVVNQSYREYEQLKLFKGPLKSWYLLMLSLLTVLILFSAIWIGFYVAREISVPIQRLAEGTRAVARGNLDFKIREQGDDEIAYLVGSFNTMTADLKRSRADVEQRTSYIEAILSNLAVGVIGVDAEGRVTLINAAAELCGVKSAPARIGERLETVLAADIAQGFLELVAEVENNKELTDAVDCEMSVTVNGSERRIICTAGKILDKRKQALGAVLLVEDVTNLLQAQQMAAWREVARRIAHEIKNPLTPIQLSAQRLQRLLKRERGDQAVNESTQTIVENVNSIKRLIDEFSNFARMPTAQFEPSNLNSLIADTLAAFVELHPKIVFRIIAEKELPEAWLDREQIRRVIINLVDNAVGAVTESAEADGGERACITLRSGYDRVRRVASLEVIDNGAGISARVKSRIFEPYFTTKRKGTGLGLAIVSSIVTDHQGQIRVFDAPPHGTRFLVELPLSPKAAAQRGSAEV